MYAAGLSAAEIVKRIQNDSVFGTVMRSVTDGLSEGLTTGFLRAALPVSTFAELNIPTVVVAADFWSRDEVVIGEGDLASAITASSALPGLIKPIMRDGLTLIDGGCVNPVPFDVMKGKVGRLAAINVAGVKDQSDATQAPNRTNAFFAAFQIMQNSILREKLKATPVDFLAQPGLRNVRVLEFNRADEIMESAREDVVQFRQWVEGVADAGGA
jgi:NTE family protein